MARSNTDRQEEYLAQAQIDFIRSFGSVYQSGINEGERKSAEIIAKQAAALSEQAAEIASLKAELAALKNLKSSTI